MSYRVGGDVDYRCTRCKMELAHTILAMVDGVPVQVKCNTCHSTRKFRVKLRRTSSSSTRRAPTRSSSSRSSSSRTVGARKVLSSDARTEHWAELMAKADAGNVARRVYNMRETFEVGQVIDHNKFGAGVVEALVDRKIRVIFNDGERLLIHGRTL